MRARKPGGPVSFTATPEFEFVWLYSLKSLIGMPLDFKGFMNIVLPKGKTGFGGDTYTEILARADAQPGCRLDGVQQAAQA